MEQTLDKQMMESLRELAKINGEISSGKVEIIHLKKDLDRFLEERGRLENEKIQLILQESNETIKKIYENKDYVVNYFNEVKSFSKFLQDIHEVLNKSVESFKIEQELWDEKVKKDSKQFAGIKQELENQSIALKRDKEYIENSKKQIAKDREYIRNQQETIKANIIHIRKNK